MKWIPVALMGVAAFLGSLLGTLIANPLYARDPSSGMAPFLFNLVAMIVYLVVVIAILAAIPFAFLRLAWVGRRTEFATSMALGATRSELIRRARVEGLRMGVFASIAGIIAGALYVQVGPFAEHGWEPFTSQGLYPLVAVAWLLVMAIVIATTSAIYGIAMSSMTRGTPVEAATAVVADSASERGLGRLREPGRGIRVVLALFAFAWVVMLVDRLTNIGRVDFDNAAETVWLSNTVGVLAFIAAISAPVIGWFVLRLTAEALTGPVARALRYGTRGLGARSFAADGLMQRTGLRTGAVMTMAIVAALSTATLGTYTLGDHLNYTAERLNAPVAVTSYADGFFAEGPNPHPDGLEQTALDPSLLAALSADSRIHVVPFARLRAGDPYEYTELWPDGRIEESTRQDTYLAVDVAASDAVVPDGYRLLGLSDGTFVAAGEGNYSNVAVNMRGHEIVVAGVSEPVHPFWSSSRDSVVSLDWARERFGPAPISGALIYAVDDTVSVRAVVSEYVTPGQAYTYSHNEDYGVVMLSRAPLGASGTVLLAGLIIAVALIVAMSTASQRLRRREYATMAALGATPASLRVAPAIEAAVTASIAIVTGVAVGLTYWLATANPYLMSPGAPIDAGEALWHLGAHLGLFPWTSLAIGALVTVASAALASLVFGASMQQRTPVEELRTAMKEGVS
ncbi:MAG: hypothetical protein CVT64_01150 [Actinobacteria bacterium HGW-Actinobacteria-4]|nr:MAG: hypothetical protein CVT64_01150 [Actinobacteria bacterium HGW-Actinobacteria-4]